MTRSAQHAVTCKNRYLQCDVTRDRVRLAICFRANQPNFVLDSSFIEKESLWPKIAQKKNALQIATRSKFVWSLCRT